MKKNGHYVNIKEKDRSSNSGMSLMLGAAGGLPTAFDNNSVLNTTAKDTKHYTGTKTMTLKAGK